MSLYKWLVNWHKDRQVRKQQWQCIKYVDLVMQRPCDQHTAIGYLDVERYGTSVWHADRVKVTRCRVIRGDLVTVSNYNDRVIGEWVDQSHQYGGLLGKNDIKIHTRLFIPALVVGEVVKQSSK